MKFYVRSLNSAFRVFPLQHGAVCRSGDFCFNSANTTPKKEMENEPLKILCSIVSQSTCSAFGPNQETGNHYLKKKERKKAHIQSEMSGSV